MDLQLGKYFNSFSYDDVFTSDNDLSNADILSGNRTAASGGSFFLKVSFPFHDGVKYRFKSATRYSRYKFFCFAYS